MPSVSFSLTEKAVIDPILTLRAPLSGKVKVAAVIWQFIQAELIARVIAVFTLVFAAADALIHFATGLYVGVCLLARINYSKSIAYGHFKQATWFTLLTAVGSVVGIVWPGIFKHCRYAPPSPSNLFPDAPLPIQKLADIIQKNGEAAFDQLEQFWKNSSLEDKHWFVVVFSKNEIANFEKVRRTFANTVYQSVSMGKIEVNWLSQEEINQGIGVVFYQANICLQAFYYHATSERALESILKSKRVEVRHEKTFSGAFVSTWPESFGRCILAFKRNIERLSSLSHGFPVNGRYWAGFSHGIPVTDTTLAYIMLENGSHEECESLEKRCRQWTGRTIKVVSLHEADQHLRSLQRLDLGIPSEWPTEGDKMAQQIVTALQNDPGDPVGAPASVAVAMPHQFAFSRTSQRVAVAH